MTTPPLRIGIDLGGSKIELRAFTADGRELHRQRVATPSGDYMGTIMAIGALVESAELALSARGTVGIGIPGAESLDNGLIKNANSTCLNGRPLRRDLQTVLQREVRLANDANCFALSEATDGAAAGAGVVFGVILGTGVGGGLVVEGKLIAGANRIAGEWGHNPLPAPAAADLPLPPCYCGRHGCIETYLSGPGAQAEHDRLNPLQEQRHLHPLNTDATTRSEDADPTSRALVHNFQKTVERAAQGDPLCAATLDRYADRLARALASVINIVDPDVIVLGGGISQVDMLYAAVPRRWGPHVFSDSVRTRLVPPLHGDASGVRGAAWLWND